jgi:hypothetical protein
MNLRLSIILFAAACAACSQNGMPQQQNSSQSGAGAPADRSAGSGSSGSAAPGAQASRSPSSGAALAESKPQFKEVTIPSGTTMAVKLANSVGSDSSKVEDAVRGTLAKALVVGGKTVVPAGSEVDGIVLEASQSGHVKGRASLAISFDRLRVGSESHTIRTARIVREAEPTKGDDAEKVGIGAGAGALVGAIAGGKKGALIGTAVGAGAGTGVVLATRGDEVRLAAGTTVTTTLQQPVTILVAVQ